jgi:hypothetical protein
MMALNYPNHPLFRIAPLLDKGFNTVLHDEYTSRLVGRIRAGRYTPELWDCNSLILGYGERSGPVYRNQTAFKSRYSMTAQETKEIRDYQNSPEGKAERARMAKERAAKKVEFEETALAARRREAAEERQRVGREIEARLAKQKAEREQQDREWAERSVQLAKEAAERENIRERERARAVAAEAVARVKRTERAAALVAAELARRDAEYEAAKARLEQRATAYAIAKAKRDAEIGAEAAEHKSDYAKRRERAAAIVEVELSRVKAEREAAAAMWAKRTAEMEEKTMQQRYTERTLRRVREELAKPTPNQELLAIFSRWLDAPKDQPNPQNPG